MKAPEKHNTTITESTTRTAMDMALHCMDPHNIITHDSNHRLSVDTTSNVKCVRGPQVFLRFETICRNRHSVQRW